jgi:hypothetical protein
MDNVNQVEKGEERSGIKGWFYVCGLALFFLLYGLFMFYMIGDKGPPEWNFGTIEDTPGESVYSTNEPITGGSAAPNPQHVSQEPKQADMQKPSQADNNPRKEKP